MSIFKVLPSLLSFSRQITTYKLLKPLQASLQQPKHEFSILSSQSHGVNVLSQSGSVAPKINWLLNFVRTNIRNNFPRPSENKRIKVLGWKARLKTKGGRAIIMRRILKGRHVLTH